MRKIDNWDAIEEMDGFDNPKPGAYIARITFVDDVEEKEYLRIEWDFAEGAYMGANKATNDRAGFWPTPIIRSYKDSALGFFKAFKTALEKSNPGYAFEEERLNLMVGKCIGVVLGEEGYTKKNGRPGKRLYVHQTRSIEAIQKGDFEVPEYREAKDQKGKVTENNSFGWDGQATNGFADLADDDGELPF